MIFQDPLSALTPVYSIGDQIVEAIQIHHDVSKAARPSGRSTCSTWSASPTRRSGSTSFPHEFSGGMRQRAMIAMSIANDPDVIIADEPTTALDVTIQAQVLEVLKKAQQETGAAMIMITHDLGVVAGIADRVTVMYAGRPVEQGTVDEIFYQPRMPYTIGLLGAVPRLDATEKQALATSRATRRQWSTCRPGCPFVPALPAGRPTRASTAEPPLAPTDHPAHLAACIYSDRIAAEKLTYADIFPVPPLASSPLDERSRGRAHDGARAGRA